MYSGYIDYVRDGEVVGWLAGVNPHALPAVLVDGVPAQNLEVHLPREDVHERLGFASGCGFRARILQRVHGDVDVELWAASAGDIVPVCARRMEVHANPAGPAALARAAAVARRPNSVAVVVWEGAHNPVGRAKVLYDIVAPHRPAVLFAFTFGTFGAGLWPPIANAALEVVLVPYAERFAFADLFREAGVAFDTVWICKDRLPSFELAQMVAHPRTRFILDMDDDEENFARATSRSNEPYGALGINKAAFLRGRITPRTVASRALQARFGGRIVRHVRTPHRAGGAAANEAIAIRSGAGGAGGNGGADGNGRAGGAPAGGGEANGGAILLRSNGAARHVAIVTEAAKGGAVAMLAGRGAIAAGEAAVALIDPAAVSAALEAADEADEAAAGAWPNGHARAAAATGQPLRPLVDAAAAPFRFIFMGTVRPHKNLEAAARALALFRFRHGRNVSLTIGGTFDPPALKGALAAAGAEIVDAVEAAALGDMIAQYDAVLAGYPDPSDAGTRISDWQISSKVGDALAAGRPVLVPAGPSTADLAGIPGVVLFDEAGFDAAVAAAMAPTRPIALPDDFTHAHAFAVFCEAEAEAAAAPRAPVRSPAWRGEPAVRPSLLLLWKQNDAGLFGRRVDQIARLYASEAPDHDVHVVEIDPYATGRRPAPRTDMACLDALSGKLAAGKELARRDGAVLYRTLSYGDAGADVSLSRRMLSYLQANRLSPADTVAVVFPFNRRFNAILNLLEPYPVIADVIDHQLMWETFERRPVAVQQYFALSRLARFEVFNSEANRDAFAAANLLNPAGRAHVIPNWYILPDGLDLAASEGQPPEGVFYSGNFNDRIDWELLAKVAQLAKARGEALHLVGSGEHAADRLVQLVAACPAAVFHGPMHETDTLWLAASARAAIMPHRLDQHSAHMDPIKIRMYGLIGLPCVSTAVPGPQHDGRTLFVAADHDAFLARLAALLDAAAAPAGATERAKPPADGLRYLDLIGRARRERPRRTAL